MRDIFIPLQGPLGVKPKAPAVGAWTSPGYFGRDVREWEAKEHTDEWYGLRCDDLVVIDCDNSDAAQFWLRIAHPGLHIDTGQDFPTWVRKTPNGWHFIYSRRHPQDPDAPATGVWDHIDIRAGRTSQIVFYAPGYHDITTRLRLHTFDHTWLAGRLDKAGQVDRTNDEEWDEMPDGRGNNTMFAIAGTMRKQGMSMLTIAKCLGAINTITMTRDPMPRNMIVQIAQSVSRYAAKPDIDIEIDE